MMADCVISVLVRCIALLHSSCLLSKSVCESTRLQTARELPVHHILQSLLDLFGSANNAELLPRICSTRIVDSLTWVQVAYTRIHYAARAKNVLIIHLELPLDVASCI